MNPNITIIILNYNGWKDTIECLESLFQIKYSNYDVILVDNASKDDSIKKIEDYCNGNIRVKSNFFNFKSENKPIKIIKLTHTDHNYSFKHKQNTSRLTSNKKLFLIENELNSGFAEGNNIGINFALKTLNPEYLLLLNNDTVVDEDFLNELVDFAEENPNVGYLGPKVYYYDIANLIQFTGGGKIHFKRGVAPAIFSDEFDEGQHDKPYTAEWIGGSCLLCKREVIEDIGLLDKKYFLCWEEVDFCLRGLKKGYTSYYVNKAKIWHKGGISSSNGNISLYYGTRNTFYFLKKNASKLQYYSFLLYFFGLKFWISTGVYLFYKHDLQLYSCFLKAMTDGIKMKIE